MLGLCYHKALGQGLSCNFSFFLFNFYKFNRVKEG